jgi:phosphoglycerate kinase
MAKIENYNFEGKRALIRVDFNVPLAGENYEIQDDTRIRAAVPTIQKILAGGGSVVLMSHLGRPKTGPEEKFSLRHLVAHLSKLLNHEVIFVSDCIGKEAIKATQNLEPGSVVLLENLRFYKEETAGDLAFAEQLSKHGDCYVNDAFGTAHRAHASTTVVAQFFPQDKMFGYLIENEIIAVDKVLNSTEKPLTAIVGGAKVSSKITILERLLDRVDHLIIGGGMAYTFIKAQGGSIGSSLVEDEHLETASKLVELARNKGVSLHLPVDTIAADAFDNNANQQDCDINQIPDGWMGLDIAAQTIQNFSKVIESSKLILWNGPMGVFEFSNFNTGTKKIGESIGKATQNGAYSLVGGGDSVAAVNQFGLADQVSYVSTGGGAMLEYLEGIELPGIKAILS